MEIEKKQGCDPCRAGVLWVMPQTKSIPFLTGVAKTIVARIYSFRAPRETPAQSVLRSKLDTRKWSPELLKQLEWRRFEELCAAYYEALGLTVRVTPAATEGSMEIPPHAQGSARPNFMSPRTASDAYRVRVM